MSRRNIYIAHGHPQTMTIRVRNRYGILNFIFDLFMIGITGGLWFVWILIRLLRNN